MKQEDIKTVQRISLDILLDIKDLCEKHNIEFFLLYGTLLGAIRHDGFIPWDDDIDIGMTRTNYLKFLKIARKELKSQNDIFLSGSGSTKYVSEMKIGRKSTIFLPKEAIDLKRISRHITVDIFMVDYMREYGPKMRKIANYFRRFLMTTKLNWDEKKLLISRIKSSDKHMKLFYIAALYFMHCIRAVFTEKGLEFIVYKIYVKNKTHRFGVMTGDTRVRVWPADFKLITHKFEGIEMPIPECYDLMLKESYGDYMQLPPENKRYQRDFDNWILELNSNG